MVTLNRRELLASALGVSALAGFGVPGLSAFTGPPLSTAAERLPIATTDLAAAHVAPGPLVVCTLFGGNDGLNTVVPYESGIYRDWRGSLAIGEHAALPLGSHDGVTLGFHPALTGLHKLFARDQVAVICGVEYPNPDFSHFASTSIWETADPSGDKQTGWIGRWLDTLAADPLRALGIGPTLPQALIGAGTQASSLTDNTRGSTQLPGQATDAHFMSAYNKMMAPSSHDALVGREVGAAGLNLLTVGDAAEAALDAERPPRDPAGRDSGDIGVQLGVVAELIRHGVPTEAYNVTFGSFDTHAGQAPVHALLLSQLDAAISAFMTDFPTASAGQSPVMIVTSEFGRTPMVNGSAGTDHSSPSVVLVVGPGVRGGFYGAVPSFTKLDTYGNQVFTTDFRSVYATVLQEVLRVDAADILGGSFPTLGFL